MREKGNRPVFKVADTCHSDDDCNQNEPCYHHWYTDDQSLICSKEHAISENDNFVFIMVKFSHSLWKLDLLTWITYWNSPRLFPLSAIGPFVVSLTCGLLNVVKTYTVDLAFGFWVVVWRSVLPLEEWSAVSFTSSGVVGVVDVEEPAQIYLGSVNILADQYHNALLCPNFPLFSFF